MVAVSEQQVHLVAFGARPAQIKNHYTSSGIATGGVRKGSRIPDESSRPVRDDSDNPVCRDAATRQRKITVSDLTLAHVNKGIQVNSRGDVGDESPGGSERARSPGPDGSDDEVPVIYLSIPHISVRVAQDKHPAAGLDQIASCRPADDARQDAGRDHGAGVAVVIDGDRAGGGSEIDRVSDLGLTEGGGGTEDQLGGSEVSGTPGQPATAKGDDQPVRGRGGEAGISAWKLDGRSSAGHRSAEGARERTRCLKHAAVDDQGTGGRESLYGIRGGSDAQGSA